MTTQNEWPFLVGAYWPLPADNRAGHILPCDAPNCGDIVDGNKMRAANLML